MPFAGLVSGIGWILIIFSFFSASTDPEQVQSYPWVRGTSNLDFGILNTYIGINIRVDKLEFDSAKAKSNVTLNAILNHALSKGWEGSIDDGEIQRNIGWDDERVCKLDPDVVAMMDDEQKQDVEEFAASCEECGSVALGCESLVILGLITQIPQLTTDLQRATVYGDVNCQATMGAVTSLNGLLSTLSSLSVFASTCYRRVPKKSPFGTSMEWRIGTAFLCMVFSTLLKAVDVICHLLVPTPHARHVKPGANVHCIEDYLMAAVTDDSAKAEASAPQAQTMGKDENKV